MSDSHRLLNSKILVSAALLSIIGSGAYACTYIKALHAAYSLFLTLSYVGILGILVAAVLSIAVLGSHGGGPLGMLLVIAAPVNFLAYVGLGVAIRAAWRLLRKTVEGVAPRN